MLKLLIADRSKIFAQAISEQVNGLYEVHTCIDGMRAIELVKQINPDVVVLDLTLSGLDGIGVLRTIHSAGYCPMVLAVTYHLTDYVESALAGLSVSHIMLKPCTVFNIAARLYEFAATLKDRQPVSADVRDEALQLLMSLGVSLCGKNFSCIHEALVYMTEYENRFVTKELYPAIAAKCGGSAKRVEKARRDAVDKAWDNRDERMWQMYFTYGKDGTIPCPSNGEFLVRLSHYLRHQSKVG